MAKVFGIALSMACAVAIAVAAPTHGEQGAVHAAAAADDGDGISPRKLRDMGNLDPQLDAEVAKKISEALQAVGTPNLGPAAMALDGAADVATESNLEALVHAVDAAHAQRMRLMRMEALRKHSARDTSMEALTSHARMEAAGLTTFQQSKTTTPAPTPKKL